MYVYVFDINVSSYFELPSKILLYNSYTDIAGVQYNSPERLRTKFKDHPSVFLTHLHQQRSSLSSPNVQM